MSVLRFPNAVSDIGKFIDTYKVVYNNLNGSNNFTHDDAVRVLIENGLASSSGAIGQEALTRSTREDRTRDPLYNQHKMYSEVYRMLGWYKPGTQRTNFNFTELSEYIVEANEQEKIRIFEECLLGMCFPNFSVDNRGGNVNRPFSFLLKLMNEAGGLMQRDEMILFVLALENDTVPDILQSQLRELNLLRGNFQSLTDALTDLASQNNTQINTLQNYTRFLLGAISYVGWAESIREKNIYGRSIVFYQLTDKGREQCNKLANLIDIRYSQLLHFTAEERVNFTLLTHYNFLESIGYNISDFSETIDTLVDGVSNIFNTFSIENRNEILFSPVQQSSPEDLSGANALELILNP